MAEVANENLYGKREKLKNEALLLQRKREIRNKTFVLILLILIFISASFLNMLSASIGSITEKGYSLITKHFINIFVGLSIGIAFSLKKFSYQNFNKNKVVAFLYFGSLIVIFAVICGHSIFPKIIPTRNGAIGWVVIGSFTIQPVELIKIPYVITLAHVMDKCKEKKSTAKNTFFSLSAIIVSFFTLIYFQKDLGTAIHYALIGAVMIFLTDIPIKVLAWLAGIFVSFGFLFLYYIYKYINMEDAKSYKLKRIISYINGLVYNVYDKEQGYQVGQSLIAFGSGGIGGKGYGNGLQKYSYVPEIGTDFITASFGEEFGFVGMMLFLFFFMVLFINIKNIALYSKDYFGRCLALGIGSLIILQVFINLSVAIGILPVFGLPMPFFSYGGSSIITIMAGLGIVKNILSHSID